MNPLAVGIGALLAAFGAYLAIVVRKKTEERVTELKFMKAAPLAEILSFWKSLVDQGLGDNYRDMVETNGTAVCDGQLRSPYGDIPCVYYEAMVTREYEREEVVRDKEGRTQRRVVRASEPVSSQKSPSPVYISDGGIRIGLDLDGADIDLKEGADRFEPYESSRNYSFFGVRFSSPSGSRTLGFRYKERIIPVGHPLYVVGEARASAGGLRIGLPSEGDKPFIVSVKSEEEVTRGEQGKAKMQLFLGIALVVIGIVVALFVK